MDLLQRAGEGYLSRKVMGLPQQLENAAVKQFKEPDAKKAPAAAPSRAPPPPAAARSRPPPKVHAPQQNALVSLRDAEKDEEIARLRKELAAAKLERNDARYVPHSSYSRRSSPDSPISPTHQEYLHSSSNPRREVGRNHEGRLVNISKPRRSSTLPSPPYDGPQPQVLDLGRRTSIAGPGSVASSAASYAPPQHHPRHSHSHNQHQPELVAIPLGRPRHDSVMSHHSHHSHHDDYDASHRHGTTKPHAHRGSNSVQMGESWAEPGVQNRNVQYGFEAQGPAHLRRRSDYGWDVESWASSVPQRTDRHYHQHQHQHQQPPPPSSSVTNDSHHKHHRERQIREERFTTRSAAMPPGAAMHQLPTGMTALALRGGGGGGGSSSTAKAPSVAGNNVGDEYDLIEIDGGEEDSFHEPQNLTANGFDMVEVIEDGRRRRRRVRRNTMR